MADDRAGPLGDAAPALIGVRRQAGRLAAKLGEYGQARGRILPGLPGSDKRCQCNQLSCGIVVAVGLGGRPGESFLPRRPDGEGQGVSGAAPRG